MSSINSISPEKLVRLVGAPRGPADEDFAADSGFITGASRRSFEAVAGWASEYATRAIGDWRTVLIALAALTALFLWKISNPLLIAVCAGVGLIAYPVLQRVWVKVR